MEVYTNCTTRKTGFYSYPHTLFIPGYRSISIIFENKYRRIKEYYTDKLGMKMIATATDTKGNIFEIYASENRRDIIAISEEKEIWRY